MAIPSACCKPLRSICIGSAPAGTGSSSQFPAASPPYQSIGGSISGPYRAVYVVPLRFRVAFQTLATPVGSECSRRLVAVEMLEAPAVRGRIQTSVLDHHVQRAAF